MEVNRSTLEGIRTNFSTIFNGALSTAEPTYKKIAMTVPSTTRTNDYRWLGMMPGLREWVGDRVVHNLAVEGYKITNKSFEDTIGVGRDDIEDDNIGVYAPFVSEFGRAAAEHPDAMSWDLLKLAETELCYDGQPFFDADHPVLDKDGNEQSVSNTMGGSGTAWYLLDTTRMVKPLIFQDRQKPQFVAMDSMTDESVFTKKEFRYGVDMRAAVGFGLWQLAVVSKQTLNEDNYAAARQRMMELTGDYGRPLNIKPSLLVVPPSLDQKGRKIIMAENDASGATNVYKNTAELHTEQRLAA